MSKSKKSAPAGHENKGFLALAGEALSVLGTDIVEGKDKVVEVTTEKISVIKQAVGNIIHKKKSAKPQSRKAAPKKKAGPKKKAAPKKKAKAPVKKAVKKGQPKKAAARKKG